MGQGCVRRRRTGKSQNTVYHRLRLQLATYRADACVDTAADLAGVRDVCHGLSDSHDAQAGAGARNREELAQHRSAFKLRLPKATLESFTAD